MIANFLTKLFGSRNARLLKKYKHTVLEINALEESISALTDEELKAKTEEFRKRFQEGESLDALLPETFAVVREASKRTLKMRHFDSQLIGGVVLHQGKISEMKTGEGKTLVATLAIYLNAIPGRGTHVVTVNDYLALRDSQWMGKIYNFLGMSVGVVLSHQDSAEKREAYQADITYGTNNEYGFDYLRDNMADVPEERFQRDLVYAVIDEVDSILVDEARTPLIISGPAEERSDLYQKIDTIIPKLIRQKAEGGGAEGKGVEGEGVAEGDYSVDEKAKQAFLTESGHERVEELLEQANLLPKDTSLYDVSNIALLHHINAALRAHSLFQREVDYIVQDDEIIIIDEFTGRMMPGRRWSEGLHQAVEAKEGVKIQSENQTLASITFQNYFRLYDKLAGMTGTADTEAFEFQQIYGLEVLVIPTNEDMVRQDFGDQIYRTSTEKDRAIIEDIKDCHERQQPVLVGTISIEGSEHLSNILEAEKIPHNVLNAKQHEKEAQIIAEAGSLGAVTIATNMAGRGTDIVLGGNLDVELEQAKGSEEEIRADWQLRHNAVVEAGGLHVIGTERHESRRIDNQLRGRSGRQGDPGSSRFYLSLEDGLMRIFGSERISGLMVRLGMEEGEAIEHKFVTKAIENAQKKVEGRNFDIRKQLLEYDNVANDQRSVIYDQRNQLMESGDISSNIAAIRAEVLEEVIDTYVPSQSVEEQWNADELEQVLDSEYGLPLTVSQWLKEDENLTGQGLRERVLKEADRLYDEKVDSVGEEQMREAEKFVMLRVVDREWKDHLSAMDHLRQGIHLRGYAQKNPKDEFKREAFFLFTEMLSRIKHEVVKILPRVQIHTEADMQALSMQQERHGEMEYSHPSAYNELESGDGDTAVAQKPIVREGRKVGRNEPCPCGSEKKYKRCHGRLS